MFTEKPWLDIDLYSGCKSLHSSYRNQKSPLYVIPFAQSTVIIEEPWMAWQSSPGHSLPRCRSHGVNDTAFEDDTSQGEFALIGKANKCRIICNPCPRNSRTPDPLPAQESPPTFPQRPPCPRDPDHKTK